MINEDDLCEDLFDAYYDARRNKRGKKDALEFEVDYERKLLELAREIRTGAYTPSPCSCFIVKKPVKREIFAADFRDRIVHHLIYNYINPIFERTFINDSYSCRIGKGTSYGIKRLNHFIRSCSENYQKDCYVLKLDISGYFMSINKKILHGKIKERLSAARERERLLPVCEYEEFYHELIENLIEKTMFHDSSKNFTVKGNRGDWAGLPKSKSLFFSKTGCGLPIGNLTSQLFGNIYLNEFDHYVKRNLKIKYYGRYVDDMVFVHRDKDYLKTAIPQIRNYLKKNLALSLHEKKIYLQHNSRGVDFLGTIIKPYRIYIKNRTKGNFYNLIRDWNKFLKENENKLTKNEIKDFLAGMNSYLGIMSHYDTAKLRQKIISSLSAYFWNYVYIENGFLKKRF